MLSTDAPFPFPGSRALLEDELWRVLRHNADGTATIYRDGARPGTPASLHRAVALSDLTDPDGRIARRADAALAVRLALGLQSLDAIRLVDAIDRAQIIIGQHRLPFRASPALVRSILEDLGWRRATGTRGPIVYLRGSATMAGAAA